MEETNLVQEENNDSSVDVTTPIKDRPSARKIKWMRFWRGVRIFITLITTLFLVAGALLPVLMRWLCVPMFDVTWAEYLVEVNGDGLLLIGFVVGGTAAGFMFYSSARLSLFGMLASIASIIATQLMYGCWAFTIILIVGFVLGPIVTFGGMWISSRDALDGFIQLKSVFTVVVLGGMSAIFIYFATKCPIPLPPTLQIVLWIGGIMFIFLIISMFITADRDEERLQFLEFQAATHSLIIHEYDRVTDYGRYPERWE